MTPSVTIELAPEGYKIGATVYLSWAAVMAAAHRVLAEQQEARRKAPPSIPTTKARRNNARARRV